MAKKSRKKEKKLQSANSKAFEEGETEAAPVKKNWAEDTESDVYQTCLKMYPDIKKSYENKDEANDEIEEYWNIFNAILDDNQFYQGNSQAYIPTVRDSLNARAKRALKQLFPRKYKHVDAVGTDNRTPHAQLALLEHYIRTTKLKSTVRSMLVAGDVTGQWNLYVDWLKDVRNIRKMVKRNPLRADGLEDVTEEEEETIEDAEITEQGPTIIDFATGDLSVVPPTCNDIQKADTVTLKLRMSEDAVQRMVDEGVFIIPEGQTVSDWFKNKKAEEKHNPQKDRTHDAGIKTEGTFKYALIYETTAFLELEKGKKVLAYIYFAGEKEIVGIIRAPQWNGKRPILSAPVDRIAGSFFGISKVEAVKTLQWNLNDFHNMGQDSAMYSLLPIIMTDPEKNPRWQTMVLGLAAIWPVDPNTTKFAEFPQLWKESAGICETLKNQIKESLDVNDMMMGLMPKGRKNNAMMGMLQQESAVTVTDNAERFEEEILNPLMEMIFEYDSQFRDKEITIYTRGEIGVQAALETIPPQSWDERYFFQWSGTDFVMNMQRIQQQIAMMNVLRGIPPQQLNGRRLDITPILESMVSNVFGEEMSGRILVDERNKYTVPPELEDEMMVNGIVPEVHESDDDIHHIQVHQQAAQQTGDMGGIHRTHISLHMQSLQKKRQIQMAVMRPQPGMPGVPGGAGPGVAGTPRPGAQPVGPRPGMQSPPGAIHPDQMQGAPGRG